MPIDDHGDEAFGEAPMLQTVRRALLALLVVFMLGTGLDLMLLDHHEDAWQLVPLALLAAGLVVSAWALRGRAGAITAMRILMVLFVAAGFLGITLHYLGNREFQLEMDPAAAGWPLFVKVVTAKSPPASPRVDGHDGAARPHLHVSTSGVASYCTPGTAALSQDTLQMKTKHLVAAALLALAATAVPARAQVGKSLGVVDANTARKNTCWRCRT